MSNETENMKHVINRFSWINNDMIKIISKDGIERLIDIKQNFKEIQFNIIPMFNREDSTKFHIILDKPSVSS
jgi:hypothetical protein